MKPQDILFFIVFLLLILTRRQSWLIYAGLVSLVLAVPLFGWWVFFTAERLSWYAAAFLGAACIYEAFIWKERRV